MKTLLIIIFSIIIGYLLGAITSFNLIADFSVDKMNDIVSDSLKNVYTGEATASDTSKKLLDQQKANIQKSIDNKTQEIKDNIKTEIKDYINQSIENIFSGK